MEGCAVTNFIRLIPRFLIEYTVSTKYATILFSIAGMSLSGKDVAPERSDIGYVAEPKSPYPLVPTGHGG